MKSKVLENAAVLFVVVVLVAGLGYSVYQSLFSSTSEKQKQTEQALIQSCQKALARSVIFQNFANEASAARRAQAAEASAAGDQISAKNQIATAERYELYARQYDALTTKNCVEFYSGS